MRLLQRMQDEETQCRREVRVERSCLIDLSDQGCKAQAASGGNRLQFIEEGIFDREARPVAMKGNRALADHGVDR